MNDEKKEIGVGAVKVVCVDDDDDARWVDEIQCVSAVESKNKKGWAVCGGYATRIPVISAPRRVTHPVLIPFLGKRTPAR